MIERYFSVVRATIGAFRHVVTSSSLTEKTYSEQKGYITGTLWFTDDSVLEFTEVKSITKKFKDKYSYHYMDSAKQLLFRYDNSPHFRELSTFPHHLHLPDETLPSTEPDLADVLKEIERLVLRKG